MKTINEMSLNELAEYVVTLPSWEWMPGIQTTTGRISRVLTDSCYWESRDSETQSVVLEQYLDQYLELDGDYTSDPSGFRPDLNDPATLGCLLAMVRKLWKDPGLSVVARYVGGEYLFRAVGGHHHGKTFRRMSEKEYTHEAHALVAALAKEITNANQ